MKIELEIDCYISAEYKAGRQPINCQDPSKPEYYDNGEDAEMTDVCIELYGVDITDTIATYEPTLYDRIVDKLYDEGVKR